MLDYVEIDERIRVRNPMELLKCDIIVNVNKFNEQSVTQFKAEFRAAHESGQEIIPIYIDSFGGEVYALMAMMDLIKGSDKQIATIVVGKAMSAGAVLLTCGDEGLRFASPTSTIMIHDLSMGTIGKIEEIKTDVEEGKRLNKILFNTMDQNCGLEKGTMLGRIRDKHNSTDWYLTPKQAKRLNMINYASYRNLSCFYRAL